jgi:Putative beta-barrel porin-2, OmpL-like. bbp2
MNTLNKLPMALTILGLGAATSFAEIKLTDNLSTSGFLDMSMSGVAPDVGDATLNASFDQFELDFMYKFGDISARADINATPSVASPGSPKVGDTSYAVTSAAYLEQAYVNYALGPLGLTAGRFLSASGFEAAEPTGMFQYSYSKTLVYGYYQNGLALNYAAEKFAVYGAVVADLWNPQEFEILETPGFEGQVSVMPIEGVTAKLAYLYQMIDDGTDHDDQQLLNLWAQYAKGNYTFAAEYNMLIDWNADGANGNGWLAMTNIKWTDKVATTFRYSGILIDDNVSATKDEVDSEVTFSPSFAVSSNFLVLAELKQEIDKKNTNYAVEGTFSF